MLAGTLCPPVPAAHRVGVVHISLYIIHFSLPYCKKSRRFLGPTLVGLQYILNTEKKRIEGYGYFCYSKATTPNANERSHTLHEQQYNTGHEVSAIPDEICKEVWRQACKPEVQQIALVHLLLAQAMGWNRRISGLSIQEAAQPSQTAYTRRTRSHLSHAPQKPEARSDGTLVPPET